MERIRSILTLTDDEIISTVDLLLKISRPVIDGVELMSSGDMRYRKIEVKSAEIVPGIIFRISYAEEVNSKKDVVSFILEDGINDIFILPVNRARYTADFVNPLNITSNFAGIDQPVREVYMFFAENLQLWNLSIVPFSINNNIKDDWYTVEEKIIID
ncbi:MAG: hypothetical protein V4456_11600 [Bacteroidota bacterium]